MSNPRSRGHKWSSKDSDLARWMTLENVKQPMSRKIALASVTVNHPVYRQQENSQELVYGLNLLPLFALTFLSLLPGSVQMIFKHDANLSLVSQVFDEGVSQ